ncbi:MAG: hypothetical protein B7Z15_16960, partial [Rhizobiales bacterium 32-66-8]
RTAMARCGETLGSKRARLFAQRTKGIFHIPLCGMARLAGVVHGRVGEGFSKQSNILTQGLDAAGNLAARAV